MPITIPKPVLLLPKVPSLVVVGLLAAQFLLFGNRDGADPKCTLNIERPHYSTNLSEYENIDAIKLNITSTCNVPQKYTEITSSIQKIENNREMTARDFPVGRAFSSPKSPKVAIFKDLFTKCLKGKEAAYSGTATGFVFLQNGKKYPVSGSSGKFEVVPCWIGAH